LKEMAKLFWTSFSLFAASAVAVPLGAGGVKYVNNTSTENVQAPSQVNQQDNGQCGGILKTVYITETATPSPTLPVVTVEIAIATPTSSVPQSSGCSDAASASDYHGAPIKEPEAPKAPEAPEAPAAAEPKTPEAPAPESSPEAKAPEAPAPEAPVTPPVAPPSSGSNSGSGSGIGAVDVMHSGRATYYSPNANLPISKESPVYGACGFVNTDADKVVALQHTLYTGLKSQGQSKCGSKIRIFYNGKSAEAEVVDMCPGCHNEFDLDMSESLFEYLQPDLGVGHFEMEWEFI